MEPMFEMCRRSAEGSAGDEAAVAADRSLVAPTCPEAATIVAVN